MRMKCEIPSFHRDFTECGRRWVAVLYVYAENINFQFVKHFSGNKLGCSSIKKLVEAFVQRFGHENFLE